MLFSTQSNTQTERNIMKKVEILPALEKGGMFCLGEYRGGKAETINYRDKLTGKAASFSQIGHNLESGNDMFVLQERMPEGADIRAFIPPFKKGDRIFVKLETVERVQGFLRATGTMFPVEG